MKAAEFRIAMFLFIEAYLVRFNLMTKKHMSSVIKLFFYFKGGVDLFWHVTCQIDQGTASHYLIDLNRHGYSHFLSLFFAGLLTLNLKWRMSPSSTR
jgi:hypothetical protein